MIYLPERLITELQPALISDKMLLNKNVHYVNAKYRDRLPDFIQALVEAEAKSEELTKKKPVHIFHVGARFEDIIGKIGEAHTNEQEGKEKAKESGASTGTTTSTTNQIDDKQKSATKKAENESILKVGLSSFLTFSTMVARAGRRLNASYGEGFQGQLFEVRLCNIMLPGLLGSVKAFGPSYLGTYICPHPYSVRFPLAGLLEGARSAVNSKKTILK